MNHAAPLLLAIVDPALPWTWTFVGISFVLYLYIGWRSRVTDTEGFYVAGKGVPAIANGAATAADWMSAASFIGMAGLISFSGSDAAVILAVNGVKKGSEGTAGFFIGGSNC